MFSSHVMGTFGTNRIYSVGRMVNVAYRMRWGFARVGSISSSSQMQKFITSETMARQRLRGQPNLTPRSSALLPVRITTARRPDHIRLSALVRSRSTQFIVHASSPKRGHFSAILAGFSYNIITRQKQACLTNQPNERHERSSSVLAADRDLRQAF